jgi:hypothetical protein
VRTGLEADLVEQLAVLGVGPTSVIPPVVGVPFGLDGSRVRYGGLEHLDGRAGAGLREGGQHPTPSANTVRTIVTVEEDEGRMGYSEDCREGAPVRVVDHDGS